MDRASEADHRTVIRLKIDASIVKRWPEEDFGLFFSLLLENRLINPNSDFIFGKSTPKYFGKDKRF